MKVFIKKLGGTKFEIQVNLQDTVADVKNIIETVEGEIVYPVVRQILIHRGNILTDGTSLEENNVAENDGILVIKFPGIPEQSELSLLAGVLGLNWPAPNEFDFLRESRHFLPIRAMMLTNKRTIPPILEELKKHDRELVKSICENPFDVLRLLHEHPEGSGKLRKYDAGVDKDQDHTRNWTLEELLAIERLEALGFSYLLVSEVFYSCNKDEEAAAAFLLSHMIFDD